MLLLCKWIKVGVRSNRIGQIFIELWMVYNSDHEICDTIIHSLKLDAWFSWSLSVHHHHCTFTSHNNYLMSEATKHQQRSKEELGCAVSNPSFRFVSGARLADNGWNFGLCKFFCKQKSRFCALWPSNYVTPFFKNALQKWSSNTASSFDDGWSYK